MDNAANLAGKAIYKPKSRLYKRFKSNYEFYILCAPVIILIFIFSYLPMLGIILPFKKFRYDIPILNSEWIGFDNFKFLFTSQDAWRITKNTVLMNLIFLVTGTLFSIVFALMMIEITKRVFIKFYQTVFFLPHYLSWVVVGYIAYSLFNEQYGFLNTLLQKIGLSPLDWHCRPEYWPFILTAAFLWKSLGYGCLLYYASILGIDHEYYEAAVIDGASKLQMITKITIPFLIPLITLLTIMNIGRIFNSDFGLFYYVTGAVTGNAGLLYSTIDTIDTYVYRSLRLLGDFGMSSAAALYQSVVGFILVLVTNAIVRKIDPENSLF